MTGGARGALEVTMLGRFALSYGGVPLDVAFPAGSQFTHLLQIVLHCPGGTRKGELLDALFGARRDSVEDIRHAVRSVVYNANRRLASAALPGRPRIVQKDCSCSWQGGTGILEDAKSFEAAAAAAMALPASDPGRAGALLLACRSYGGPFLPNENGISWAASESRRYGRIFADASKEACTALRGLGDYESVRSLAAHAAAAAPLSGWEAVETDALCALGRRKEALDLFSAACEEYQRARGSRLEPPPGLLDGAGAWWADDTVPLDALLPDLASGRPRRTVPYASFLDAYNLMLDAADRTGMSLYLLSCTAYDMKGNDIRQGPVMDRTAARLREAVEQSVRSSDMACRCGGCRFLVLLCDTTLEDCGIVQERIRRAFYSKGRTMTLKFEAVQPSREEGPR